MNGQYDLYFSLGTALILLSLGFFVGRHRERIHLRQLDDREQHLSWMMVSQLKSFPGAVPGRIPPGMLCAEAVVATDYFKSFLARLRNIFGGEVRSYQTLLTRARRESLLRLLEEAAQQGYNAVCNVRFNTADVGGNSTRRKTAMVSILVSATGYHVRARSTVKS